MRGDDDRMKNSKNSSAGVPFQRSKVYRLLSFSFFYPDEELAGFFRSGEFGREMEKALSEVSPVYMLKDDPAPFSDLYRKLAATGLEEMVDEHVRFLTFKSESPPYENEYHRSKGAVYSTEEMADIAGFYRAIGMDFAKERPDHIAAELEFMHVVTLKEAKAISSGEADKADACVSLEKKFLADHLGRWVDAFSDALISHGSSFYGGLGLMLKQWVNMDCAYLQVSPRKVSDFTVEQSEDGEQICLGRVV